MSAQVIVYLGPDRSGKLAELLRYYRDAVRTAVLPGIATAFWISPNARAANEVRSQLLDESLDACFDSGVMTFDELSRRCLTAAKSHLRIISPAQERELIRRTVAAAIKRAELTYYAQTARRDTFVDLLHEHFRELRRRGIDAEKFSRLRSRTTNSDQHRELAALYSEYERVLTANRLVDRELVSWAACDALAGESKHVLKKVSLVVVHGFSDFTAAQHKLLALVAKRAKQLIISLPSDDVPASLRTGRLSDQSEVGISDTTDAAARTDLFAKPIATLAELRRIHANIEVRHFKTRTTRCAALDHVDRHIFRHPVPPAGPEVLESLNRLEFIEASGAQDEIVQIARRIKRLLIPLQVSEGLGERSVAVPARPHDIVVVFRSLADAAPRIREVFLQFGIPFALEVSEPLAMTPVVKTLLSLLRLDAEDWPFRRTVAVLTNNMLTAIDADARRAADWLVRDLQIASGHRELLERVEQLAANKTPLDQLGDRPRRRIAAAQTALPALQMLRDAIDTLPKDATPLEWAHALLALAAKLGFAPATAARTRTSRFDSTERVEVSDQSMPANADGNISASTDGVAWKLFIEHLASLERLDAWLGQPQRRLSRQEIEVSLRDFAQHATLPRSHDDVGRVRVLSVSTARTIRAKHLFIAGMTEQSFPAGERPGGLTTEADYRHFARAANVKGRRGSAPPAVEPTRSQEEMLLYYELLSSAEESITISYAALDDKAQTMSPSPYVSELRRTLGNVDSPQLRVSKPHLSPVPPGAKPLSSQEWRLHAVAQALAGQLESLAGLLGGSLRLPPRESRGEGGRTCKVPSPYPFPKGEGLKIAVGRAIESGLRIVHARSRRDEFSSAEGLIASPAATARFAERFGPRHLWSPSQWETYAGCPYRFFIESVLRIEPLGDLALETDFARRGGRLHDVLAEFHRQWPVVRKKTCASPDDEPAAFRAYLNSIIEKTMASAPRPGIDAALLELDCRQIARWSEDHFEHHLDYARQWQKIGGQLAPTHFELRFGPARPGDAGNDPDSCDKPFELKINGEAVLVTGRIDRIDVARIGGRIVFNVIDYKSGRKSRLQEEHIASGEHLQLPVYVAAAQAILYDGAAQPLAAGYWSMTGGFDSKGVLAAQQDNSDKHWARIRTIVEERVGKLITGIRQGEFPVYNRDDKCTGYCEFNTVCRIAQIRSLGKTWPQSAEA